MRALRGHLERMISVFWKSLREQWRDPLALSLTLVFAPCFVFLYSLFFPSGSTTYAILVINQDVGAQTAGGGRLAAGEEVIRAMERVAYPNGSPLLKVQRAAERTVAEALLRNREAVVLIIIPEDFSRSVEAGRQGREARGSPVVVAGDLTNPYYAVAAVLALEPVNRYLGEATSRSLPVEVREQPLGGSAARTEFEVYVPGLLVFAVIMLVFLASMTVMREVEAGTLRRLQMTHMTALDYLGGVSAALVIPGVVSVALTFLTALALGFRSQGPLWVAALIGAVTSLSIIGVGLVVACFSGSVMQAFLIANFPLGFFMFFSGAIFPIPRIPLFTVAGRSIGLYDILPPTHAVVALNKVLTLGEGLGDITYELVALLVLSAFYFGIGVWLFKRRHLGAR